MTRPSPRLQLAVFLALVALWGSTWLAIKIGLNAYPVFLALAGRFLLAGAVFFMLIKLQKIQVPFGAEYQRLYLAIGLLSFFTSYAAVYWGEQYITSGLAAVLFAMFPIFTAFIAGAVLKKERFGPGRWAGLLLALAGVVAINFGDLKQIHPMAPIGCLVTLIAPFVSAVSVMFSKAYIHRVHPYAMAGVPMLYAGILHTAVWFLFERHIPLSWSWMGVGTIVYLAIPGSVITFGLYYWLLRTMSVGRTSLIAYLTPVFAVALGYFAIGEPVDISMLIGTLLILGGVGLAGRGDDDEH